MARNVTGRNATVVDKDHGYKARLEAIAKVGRLQVNVGIQGDRAADKHRGSAQHLSGLEGIVRTARSLSVGEIAAIHEFGLGGLPQRSWLRGWVDGNMGKVTGTLRNLARQVIAGKMDEERALSIAGARFQGAIQLHIRQGVPPPNAPSTVRSKGSSVPLVDTGQMRASVSWLVVSRLNVLR